MAIYYTDLTKTKRLGAGAFGQVYLGSDKLRGEVAIKAIEREAGEPQADWDSRRDDLLNEGQRLSKAEHPNVVKVFGAAQNTAGNEVVIVTEFCSGGSLQDRYAHGPLSIGSLRGRLHDVLLGLGHLHSQNMLHRDIKPANILVDKVDRARLGDFGLVTDRDIQGYASAMGYLDHLAPEVYTTGITSAKTDIWALGMTAFRLLHGRAWYEEAYPPPAPHVAQLVKDGGFALGLLWLPHVPHAWRRFIRKCMADDPSTRYQSVAQVLNALARLPIVPNWSCSLAPQQVEWTLIRDAGRTIRVAWDRQRPRKQTWLAQSVPTSGTGRTMKQGGSVEEGATAKTKKELEEFLLGYS